MSKRNVAAVAAALFALVVPTALADGILASATGAGHITIGGENRTFSFTARQYDDGSAKGEAELHARQFPAFGHFRIDCMRVVGNVVVMSGTLTQASNPAFEGARGVFAVQDNGEGGNDPPDLMSELVLGIAPTQDCNNTTPPLDLVVERGNIQVHS